jgi:hypothetical protein
MQWLIDNKEWVFSGIGVFVLSLFLQFLFNKKESKSIKQKIKSGKNSINIQAGGDVKFDKKDD